MPVIGIMQANFEIFLIKNCRKNDDGKKDI